MVNHRTPWQRARIKPEADLAPPFDALRGVPIWVRLDPSTGLFKTNVGFGGWVRFKVDPAFVILEDEFTSETVATIQLADIICDSHTNGRDPHVNVVTAR